MFDKRKKVLFLPIESTSRELQSRRLIAKNTVEKNNEIIVVIIEQQLLRLLTFIFARAVFFGKHFFSKPKHKDSAYYHRIKRKGGSIVYLHEEGVFPGSKDNWSNFLVNAMNPAIFQADDTILVWSEWQKKFFENTFELSTPIVVSGHPRFDIYKDLRSDNKPYDFLINTSFSYPNHIQGLGFIFSGKNPSYDFEVNKEFIYTNYFTQREAQTWLEKVVYQLSSEYPEKRIIIRPHPSENEGYYKSLFRPLTNVKIFSNELVEEALSKTKVLIQVGCTTAIESYFAQIPTYTNKEFKNSRAKIASDLSNHLDIKDLSTVEFNWKTSDSDLIRLHSHDVLANMKEDFNSSEVVSSVLKVHLERIQSVSFWSLRFSLIVALITYYIAYWPIKFGYYLVNNRVDEIKDFKKRYKPGNTGVIGKRFSKFIEVVRY